MEFSFVGMQTTSVKYAGQKEIDVILYEDQKELDEVVVTGYQVLDKRTQTSAITTVKAEDIMIPGVTSIDQMLEGRIPEMTFMLNSGEVGATPRLRVRGTSTLLGNREPLWVLDGIVMTDPVDVDPDDLNNPDYLNIIGNAIAGINPQDIEPDRCIERRFCHGFIRNTCSERSDCSNYQKRTDRKTGSFLYTLF